MIVGASFVLATCVRPSGPIVIGLAGPFSERRGESMRRAAELAVAQVNAQGGVRGRPLRLEIADDSGSEDTAVRVAGRLHADAAVVAVVGHLGSRPTRAAARIYGGGPRPVVLVSPSASSPELSGINPYFFRVCPSDLRHGPPLARFAWQRLGARRAGIIYTNDASGRGLRRAFADEFGQLGGTVVAADPFVATTRSLEPYLSRMRRTGGVDVLVVAAEGPGAERVLREMRSVGLRWPVIGSEALSGIETDGALAEGVRVSTAYLPDRMGERAARFVADYTRASEGLRPDPAGARTYDIVFLLARAIADAGPSRRAIREYLARVGRGRPAFEGVTGPIAFDDEGDVPGGPIAMAVVRDGRLVSEPGR